MPSRRTGELSALLNPDPSLPMVALREHGFPSGIAPDGARAPDVPSIAIAMTAPAPRGGVRRAIGPEHEHRRCGGGGRRPGGVGVTRLITRQRQGEGETPSHLSVLKLALARTLHLTVVELRAFRPSHSPSAPPPRGDIPTVHLQGHARGTRPFPG